MKFSVVTISYNQVEFLERAINSVLSQQAAELEYIIVDPGSNDGSRELIASYANSGHLKAIFEPDAGPADGLNRGFRHATGDVFFYLNSDDALLPGALALVSAQFNKRPTADVLCGHGYMIDENDNVVRRIWSDGFNHWFAAYSASIQIQPATFIRRRAFERTNGFNVENRSNWDGELMIALAASGSRIEIYNAMLGLYRVHKDSITGSGTLDKRMRDWEMKRFNVLMGRDWREIDNVLRIVAQNVRRALHPGRTIEALYRGPVYMSARR